MKQLGLICTFFVFLINPLFALQTALVAGCDTLIANDGRMLFVEIRRVKAGKLTYVQCNTLDNALHTLMLTDLREIKWSRSRMPKHKAIRWDAVEKNRVYKIWVFTHTSPLPIQGFLHHTTDSSLIVLDTEHQMADSASSHKILITNIKKIHFRKKDNTEHWALAGAFVGMCLGTILDFAFNEGDSVVYAIVITPTGALMGLIGGAAKYKFRLGGSLETFQRNRTRIRQYSLTGK